MVSQVLMDETLERVVDRLAHQLLEHHDFNHPILLASNREATGLLKFCNVACKSCCLMSKSIVEDWMHVSPR